MLCPAATNTQRWPGSRPIAGSPSGVIGRGPTHSSRRAAQSTPDRYGRAAAAIAVTRRGSNRSWSVSNSMVPAIRSASPNGFTATCASPRCTSLLGGFAAGTVKLYPLPAATDVRAAREKLRLLSRQHSALVAHIGISDPAVGVTALHDAYHDAADALRIAPNKADPIVAIADLRVHQLLAAAGHHARTRFADLLLAGLRAETDWPTQRETVLAWVESGFNLVRAARALHIHRNTLLYRLDKITTRSGRDVRDPHDALALYLACLTVAVTTPAAPA